MQYNKNLKEAELGATVPPNMSGTHTNRTANTVSNHHNLTPPSLMNDHLSQAHYNNAFEMLPEDKANNLAREVADQVNNGSA